MLEIEYDAKVKNKTIIVTLSNIIWRDFIRSV